MHTQHNGNEVVMPRTRTLEATWLSVDPVTWTRPLYGALLPKLALKVMKATVLASHAKALIVRYGSPFSKAQGASTSVSLQWIQGEMEVSMFPDRSRLGIHPPTATSIPSAMAFTRHRSLARCCR